MFPRHPGRRLSSSRLSKAKIACDAWPARLEQTGALESQSWFGSSDFDRERFRRFRHALPETSLELTQRNGFPSLGTDFSVPIEKNREMLTFYREHMESIMPGHYCIFGHMGDGHPHVNMLPRTQKEFEAGTSALTMFAKQAAAFGGSVAAEHGLGKRKARFLPIQYTSGQIESMKAVKRRLDPSWRSAAVRCSNCNSPRRRGGVARASGRSQALSKVCRAG